MSDFWGDSAHKLRDFSENSVNNSNLKWGYTIGSNMPITLQVVTLDYRTVEKSLSVFLPLALLSAFLSLVFTLYVGLYV